MKIEEMILDFIDEYKTLAAICAYTNFGNKVSAKRYNNAVDRMREIAKAVGKVETAERVEDFAQLLDIEENKINLWAALHLLEFIPINKEIEVKALSVIEKASLQKGAASCRFQVWLEEWNEKRNK